MNNVFSSICKFYFEGKYFEMFMNEDNKKAFLQIKNGRYRYPEIGDVVKLNILFNEEKRFQAITKDTKPKKVKFLPKVKKGKKVLLLSGATLASIIYVTNAYANNTINTVNPEQKKTTSTTSTNTTSNSVHASAVTYNGPELSVSTEHKTSTPHTTSTGPQAKPVTFNGDSIKAPTTEEKYASYLASADDEYDYMFKTDHTVNGSYQTATDAKSYKEVFGISKPTLNDIEKVINKNDKIPAEYKSIFIEFASSVLKEAPNADLTVFYLNLQDIEVVDCNSSTMEFYTNSSSTQACYEKNTNKMYILNTVDITKSYNKVVPFHEMFHCARNYQSSEAKANFALNHQFGFYVEEALATNYAYKLTGSDEKSPYYTLDCSYFRVIQDCLGDNYTLEDFMNHSVSYLAYQMNRYMPDENAEVALAQIESEMAIHYAESLTADYDSFDYLFDYMTKMAMKKYLKPGMTSTEAWQVFDAFYEEISYRLSDLNHGFPEVDENKFKAQFLVCCDELGIDMVKSNTK